MAAALGCARVWRFCWPDKGLKYEFIADLSGADRTVSAECQVQGLLYQLRGSLHGEWPDLRLEYTLASGPNELEVDMIAISPESFAGQWRCRLTDSFMLAYDSAGRRSAPHRRAC
eukprot:TRINITY_DN23051_c0_g1_i3.p3 TRINITY_DN23051_c0_g1~~TRINITY_DN23051_c0_g1_i3.p3  ORF type:complete len:115 (+),score=13.93 TRINITY_DN23051_c0_g1_i3:189-533(+)